MAFTIHINRSTTLSMLLLLAYLTVSPVVALFYGSKASPLARQQQQQQQVDVAVTAVWGTAFISRSLRRARRLEQQQQRRSNRPTAAASSSHWLQQFATTALRAGGMDDSHDGEIDETTTTSSSDTSSSSSLPELSILFNDFDEEENVDSTTATSSSTTRRSIPRHVLIVMDAFCEYHGLYLIQQALENYPDVAVVRVLSDYVRGYYQQQQQHDTDADNDSDHDNNLLMKLKLPRTQREIDHWKEQLQHAEKVAVYCESDSGLADAEWLRHALSSPSSSSCSSSFVTCHDDPIMAEWRRNKYLMNQQVAAAGLPAVQQELCHSLEQALQFAAATQQAKSSSSSSPQQWRVIVKPYRGVASELVHLCTNEAEIEHAWNSITSSSVFGAAGKHDSVLVQEFLEGTEYAVDVVSKNGQHKVAAIWRYDKRPANGAPFCYFQTLLVDATSDPNVVAVCNYVCNTLDALGVRWGISHNEVIYNAADHGGPKLVEVNCRQHNMDFCPLTMACIGYNAFDMMLEAFFGPDDVWDSIPDMPMLRASGCMVHFVNYASGCLKEVYHLQDIMNLPSVLDMEVYHDFLSPGEHISPTIDIRTDAGWAQLINPDKDEFEQDYRQIVEWMPTMFEVEGGE